MLNAVGIDVSKGRSTVAVLQPGGVVLHRPFDVFHNTKDLHNLARYLVSLDGETRVVMESTGRYHEPIRNVLSEAGLFVCAVNPHLIKNFGNNTLRKVKTDSADAKKIARYTLDNWATLREYSVMDTTRTELKTIHSQFNFFMKQKTSAKSNLIALLDETYPDVNKLFSSPIRSDGSEKWVDFAYSFWHVNCVLDAGLKTFTERYQRFCKRHHYEYQPNKPVQIYEQAKRLVPAVPKDPIYKELIQDSIQQLNLISQHVEQLRKKMDEEFESLQTNSYIQKEKAQRKNPCAFSGAEGETRTLAPVTRPTPLAGAPRHQLEYFCIGSVYDTIRLLKERAENPLSLLSGGESGIRTHGTLPYDGFQDRSVITTSVSLRIRRKL